MSSANFGDLDLGVIVIEDDGPGVPPGREEEILATFFTVSDDPSSEIPRGSGLGLAIGKQAVLANGGRQVIEHWLQVHSPALLREASSGWPTFPPATTTQPMQSNVWLQQSAGAPYQTSL